MTQPYYIAPEVLTGNYNEKCDIWSAGVMLYILLCGRPPFDEESDESLFETIKSYQFDFSGPEWKTVSEAAKDLIRKMLVAPEQRLSSEEVLSHRWMQVLVEKSPMSLATYARNLQSFAKSSTFKKLVLNYIAFQLTDKEKQQLMTEFISLDANMDGEISFEEFKLMAPSLGLRDPLQAAEIFAQVDVHGNGFINYSEFLAAMMHKSVYLKEEKLYQAFKMFDKNNDGFISADEIKAVLGSRRRSPRRPEVQGPGRRRVEEDGRRGRQQRRRAHRL